MRAKRGARRLRNWRRDARAAAALALLELLLSGSIGEAESLLLCNALRSVAPLADAELPLQWISGMLLHAMVLISPQAVDCSLRFIGPLVIHQVRGNPVQVHVSDE